MDFIRQQLEFEVQQVRCVMEERFGSSEEMIQRTQVSPPPKKNARGPLGRRHAATRVPCV